jgi:hypothetical protein
MMDEGAISGKMAKDIFAEMFASGMDAQRGSSRKKVWRRYQIKMP